MGRTGKRIEHCLFNTGNCVQFFAPRVPYPHKKQGGRHDAALVDSEIDSGEHSRCETANAFEQLKIQNLNRPVRGLVGRGPWLIQTANRIEPPLAQQPYGHEELTHNATLMSRINGYLFCRLGGV